MSADRDDPPAAGGTYTLLIELPTAATVEVGALGAVDLQAGGYAYTGSALGTGGFSRVDRHRRIADGEHDVRHWHIDYLLGQPSTRIIDVTRSYGADIECAVAGRLPSGPVDGFGASDCDCGSHLAHMDRIDALAERVERAHRRAAARAERGDAGETTGDDRGYDNRPGRH